MIPQIYEKNFPSYATLSTATVTLNDMGDRTITAQVKIDGSIVPDFSFDWEVEFQGERYIHPVREPQASKGNESICSVIDLTFQHWTIYQLRRFYFPKMAEIGSGTLSADSYIDSLRVNLVGFIKAFQDVLAYYSDKNLHEEGRCFDEPITIELYGNPDDYDQTTQYIEISYTHIWDVLQKLYEVYGVRWTIEGTTIKVGYPTEEVSHIFEYGFEGGLLKVERQVQSTDIRNLLLGRGGEKNLPYRYFKDEETDAQGYKWSADPDWIPELALVNFANLRGKTFRDYVKGWKAERYGGEPMAVPTEEYNRGYADSAKSEDGRYFNPIEYVEDKESIEKYGLLQGGLENQEDIYPSIQGIEVEPYGRIDEIVGAEQVVVDENTEETEIERLIYPISLETSIKDVDYNNSFSTVISKTGFKIPDGFVGYAVELPTAKMYLEFKYDILTVVRSEGGKEIRRDNSTRYERREITGDVVAKLNGLDTATGIYQSLLNIANLPSDVSLELRVFIEKLKWLPTKIEKTQRYYVPGYTGYATETQVWTPRNIGDLSFSINWNIDYTPINGILLGNYEEGTIRKSESVIIASEYSASVTFETDEFEVLEKGATNVDVPINIIVGESGQGLYEFEKTVKAVNVDTNEIVSSINIPKGKYYLRVNVEIRNNSTASQTYKIELLPSYVYFPTDTEEFKPKFDIWVKNIWGTTRNDGESDESYVERVWRPILGDKEGNEAKVVFSSGSLSGHSDYEFTIVKGGVAYAGGDGVEHNGVPAEWRLTLAKSDAELEATGEWIPSTKQQASVGDHFFFIGVDMPHQYVLWAEEKLDNYKRDQLLETAHIKPTWVVQTDKVRLNQLQPNETEPLLNALKIGNSLRLADTRFTNGVPQPLYLQSITYSWGADTIMLPNVEVVLSDKVSTSLNPVAQLQGEVDVLAKQVGSISNIQRVVRAVGDKLYLRKDGVEDASNSPTKFSNLLSSRGYRQGAVGGSGWGLRSEQSKGIFEVDKLIVRDEMQVNSLVVNQVSVIGGKEVLSAAYIECNNVEDTDGVFRCYFDLKQGSVANLFEVNDIAYSQIFSAYNNEVKYYKREVVGIGENYIDLSKTVYDGDGMPQAGDVIAQYGNTTDPNRQYVIIRDVIGGGYERMLSDLNSVDATGTEYFFAGRLDGNTPRWFVGDREGQHIEYKDGKLNIVANVQIGDGSSGLDNFTEYDSLNNYIQEAYNEAKNAKDYIDNILPKDLESLQSQIDGAIDSFFQEYDPTLSNYPANEWDTTEEKESHLNDTFTNNLTGASWRWSKNVDVYSWVEIQDTATVKALALAGQAKDTADGKRRVFVNQPTTPYDKGDLWSQGTEGRLMICILPRLSGNFSESDWSPADDAHEYANSKLSEYKKIVDETVNGLNESISNVEQASKDYTDESKLAIQKSIDELNSAKANISDVYTKAQSDGKIEEAEARALAAAIELADAARSLAEKTAEAYADGIVSEEEAKRLAQAEEILKKAEEASNTANQALESSNIVSSNLSYITDSTKLTRADIYNLELEKSKVESEYSEIEELAVLYNINLQDNEFNRAAELYLSEITESIAMLSANYYIEAESLVSARTGYYQKLAEVKKEISTKISTNSRSDLDYLKEVFPNANLDVNGASLAYLLGVKDESGNITAGLYGGASDRMNDNGFKDSNYGTLMMFAGASNLDDVENSDFRVYENGTMFVKSVRRTQTNINLNNIDSYTLSTYLDASVNKISRILDIQKTGSLIVLSGNGLDDTWIQLPTYINNGYFSNDVWNESGIIKRPTNWVLSDFLTLAGTQIYVLNVSANIINLCDGLLCYALNPGETMIAELVASAVALMPDGSTYLRPLVFPSFSNSQTPKAISPIQVVWEWTVVGNS